MTTNFEAKLHGFRRTQDGVVVSYVVHPSDVSAELATAALGTRYIVAVAEIGDDERPLERPVVAELVDAPAIVGGESRAGANPVQDSKAKDRRKFSDMPLSQQAGIRSTDVDFWEYAHVTNEADAAQFIRKGCGVPSRADIGRTEHSIRAWGQIETSYQSWLVTQQYSGSVRA